MKALPAKLAVAIVLVEHPSELGPVGDAAALGLVDVLAGDEVAVLVGVVPQRPQLSRDREVDILAVTGEAGASERPPLFIACASNICSLRESALASAFPG